MLTLSGGTNYKGNIVFAGEGQGDDITSALYLMNPNAPYNTTGEYHVSQFHQSIC